MATVGTKKPLNTNVQNEEHSLDPADLQPPESSVTKEEKGLEKGFKGLEFKLIDTRVSFRHSNQVRKE